MTTERVATRVSDAEMTRRWDAVRKLMRETRHRGADRLRHRGLARRPRALVHRHTDPQRLRPHRGVSRRRADGRGRAGPVRRQQGPEWQGPYHRGVGIIHQTPFFSSVDYTTRYQGEIVREIIKKRAIKTIGFVVPGTMPHGLISSVSADGIAVIDITPQIDRLIALKSDEELKLLRESAALQDAVFDKVIKTIKPGMRDVDVTAMAYAEGWVRGSSQGIYLGGSAPLGKPSFLVGRHFQDRTLQQGDNLSFLVEVNGPGGYFTEVGRTIVLGKASQRLLDNFAMAKEAQDYSVSLLKPGIACRDLAKAHDDYMVKLGLPKELRLYAHGQGYDMVERPLVRADEPMSIEQGMCLAVHPNYALDDLFMIVCDNYIVGANGSERIHKTERKVFEIY